MDILLNAVHALEVLDVRDLQDLHDIPAWIQNAPQLQVFSLCISWDNRRNPRVDWGPFSKAVEHATSMKEVRVMKYKTRRDPSEAVPRHVRKLKTLLPHHVSVFFKTQGDFDSDGPLVEIV